MITTTTNHCRKAQHGRKQEKRCVRTKDRDPTVEDLTNQNDLDDEIDEPVESPDHEDILDSTVRILEQ